MISCGYNSWRILQCCNSLGGELKRAASSSKFDAISPENLASLSLLCSQYQIFDSYRTWGRESIVMLVPRFMLQKLIFRIQLIFHLASAVVTFDFNSNIGVLLHKSILNDCLVSLKRLWDLGSIDFPQYIQMKLRDLSSLLSWITSLAIVNWELWINLKNWILTEESVD